jgi:type III restriction enzyme
MWSRHFNGLEKEVALYIDGVKAVRWWHRVAVQTDWYLDGWKKKRVFPDFLIALDETGEKPPKMVAVETKGLYLQNDDTDYKWKLFETLERYGSDDVPAGEGELALGDKLSPMRFRLVLDGDWKSQIDMALAEGT